MRNTARFAMSVSAAMICVGSVYAQSSAGPRSLPRPGGWTLTPEIGTELRYDGKILGAASESIAASGRVFGGVLSAAATVSSSARKFRDVYDRPIAFGLGGSYGLANDSEVFGRIRYVTADPKDFTAMNISVAAAFNGVTILTGNLNLNGRMNDYTETQLELGYRKFFGREIRFKPYLSGGVGFQRNNGLDVDLSYQGTAVVNDVNLYKGSTVPSLAVGIGAIYEIGDGASFGIETGFRWTGKIKDNDTDLAGGRSFEGINNNFRRSAVPLTLSVRIPL